MSDHVLPSGRIYRNIGGVSFILHPPNNGINSIVAAFKPDDLIMAGKLAEAHKKVDEYYLCPHCNGTGEYPHKELLYEDDGICYTCKGAKVLPELEVLEYQKTFPMILLIRPDISVFLNGQNT